MGIGVTGGCWKHILRPLSRVQALCGEPRDGLLGHTVPETLFGTFVRS